MEINFYKDLIKKASFQVKEVYQNNYFFNLYCKLVKKKQLLPKTIQILNKQSLNEKNQVGQQIQELIFYFNQYNEEYQQLQKLYKKYSQISKRKEQIKKQSLLIRTNIQQKIKQNEFMQLKTLMKNQKLKQIEDIKNIIQIQRKKNKLIVKNLQQIQRNQNYRKNQIQLIKNQIQKSKINSSKLQSQIKEFQFKKNSFNQASSHLYQLKKYLNNELQQIKGNIRVYCRIRSTLNKQQEIFNYKIKQNVLFIKKKKLQFESSNIQTDFHFELDQIFDINATQNQVFDEISQLVQSSIDGKNLCLFAYGQTGSGKTFTMQGKPGSSDSQGIIPRSINLIFQQISKYQINGFKVRTMISVNQIYLNQTINLISMKNIKDNNFPFQEVQNKQKLQILFQQSLKNRKVSTTKSNSESSRSHLIFIIKLKFTKQFQQKQSCLVFVDLAGSQRTKYNQANENDKQLRQKQLKQANFINSSLQALGQMIRSLKNDQKFSYRNSKLTYVLHPYFKNKGRILMFVNISPLVKDQSQSINSLKFATKARQYKISKN